MSGASEGEIYRFSGFALDPRQRLLLRSDGEPIALTARAFDTLLYLVEHPNRLIDKRTLMQAVWPNAIVEENNLSQSISIVRRALGESAGEHRFVVTVPGRGFRFVPVVERLEGPPAPRASDSSLAGPDGADALRTGPTPPVPLLSDSSRAMGPEAGPGPVRSEPVRSEPARPESVRLALAHADGPGRRRLALWLAAAAAAAVVLAGGYGLVRHYRAISESVRVGPYRGSALAVAASTGKTPSVTASVAAAASAASAAAAKVRVAILPFANLSPDPANAFFADGLHEEIIAALARRAPDLQVISRTTMMTYRAHPKPVPEIARDLNAGHIIEGSVLRDARHVRLTLQIIDARTDSDVWSQSYDRTLADALTLDTEVAGEVAAQLSTRLAPPPASGPLTRNPEAYDLYLKALIARDVVTNTGSIAPLARLEGLLSRAIARDPGFARAYAQRAGMGLFEFAFSFDPSEARLAAIRADIETARRLAPDDPDVLAAEGRYASLIDQDYARAIALIEQARRAGLTDTFWLGGEADTLSRLGRWNEAISRMRQLMTVDPENPFLTGQLELTLYAARRPTDLVREFDQEISIAEDSRPADANRVRGLQFDRAWALRAYMGRGTNRELDIGLESLYPDLDFGARVLRIQHRYRDIGRLVALYGGKPVKTPYIAGIVAYAVGESPGAREEGWADLLLGDRAAAAKQGRVMLDFVSRAQRTRFNGWFLEGLEAYGDAFLGRKRRAVSAARQALALAARSRDPFNRTAAESMAAQVDAWCGAADEAAGLLEVLAVAMPGLPPGVVTEDPIYAVPLAHNARYQALVTRLDAQMRATRLP